MQSQSSRFRGNLRVALQKSHHIGTMHLRKITTIPSTYYLLFLQLPKLRRSSKFIAESSDFVLIIMSVKG